MRHEISQQRHGIVRRTVKGGFIDEYTSKDGMAHGIHRYIINGKVQAEPYVSERMGYAMSSRTVPAGHLFVLGDNRNHSYDSHFWGPLPQERVLGIPLCTYWPPLRVRGRAAYRGGPRRPLAGSRVVTRALRRLHDLHESRPGWTLGSKRVRPRA